MVVICVIRCGWSLKRKPFLMGDKTSLASILYLYVCIYIGQYHMTGKANRDKNAIYPAPHTHKCIIVYSFLYSSARNACTEETVVAGLCGQKTRDGAEWLSRFPELAEVPSICAHSKPYFLSYTLVHSITVFVSYTEYCCRENLVNRICIIFVRIIIIIHTYIPTYTRRV